ncbi:N-acetyl-beta-D-galactosaminidase [Aureococcus anophagefferens]|nr:N-acetyl-beta-D-galactosaminidase [Aureococcus anophagefferens]
MVDSSRHFLPVPTLEAILDGMAASALNVLHWHLVDAQSFPWNASFEPALVRARTADLAYQRADLERVVAYAGDRAIRVIPEIDVPGHSAAVAVGRPDLEETYAFLGALFAELRGVFRDAAVHLGGDEVQFRCLNASADFRGRMVARGYDASCPAADPPKTGGNVCANGGPGFKKVVGDFVVRAALARRGPKPGWQEIFDHYGGDDATTPTPPRPWRSGLRRRVGGLYLGSDADHGDWRAFYDVHPRSSATRNASSRGYFNVTDPAEARALGAEACLWGKRADGGDANLALWPRAAAAAEALYVGPDLGDDDAVRAPPPPPVQAGPARDPRAPLQPGFC